MLIPRLSVYVAFCIRDKRALALKLELGRIFQPLKLKLRTEQSEGSIGMVQIEIFMPNLVKQLVEGN